MEPRGFDDPGRDEWGCECGCNDTETRDELDEDGRCEACSQAGCGRSCVRPYEMTVDSGDPEKLQAWHHLSAVAEARARVLARWGWYSNDGQESAVPVKLYDGHQAIELTIRAPSEVAP